MMQLYAVSYTNLDNCAVDISFRRAESPDAAMKEELEKHGWENVPDEDVAEWADCLSVLIRARAVPGVL